MVKTPIKVMRKSNKISNKLGNPPNDSESHDVRPSDYIFKTNKALNKPPVNLTLTKRSNTS